MCAECSEKLLKEFQKTFDKNQVKIGDYIKAGFKDRKEIEHMWVEVLEICKDSFKGKLRNQPIAIKNLKEDDFVKVKFEEVENWSKENGNK